ncbi:hypothetical protein FA046_09535 [Pedobacter cryophilus]|uniref:Alginate export domain-containing protein n=2 Tax=Pedobacter cryophilus TaxID=2571271 RepID=A0A4U1BXZ4_9SPHI|nr:hypothetical protein FA046_09535 [Pedobacter cryophilus]
MLFVSLLIISSIKTQAQFSLTGQLRARGEVRKGFANLVPLNTKTAAFISQRTRLNFGYKWDRLTFGVTAQDVRVWGQDASSISNADGSRLMLHEGWAEVTLANKADTTIKFKLLDNLSLKIGRQELIYDDARLIGNLDWLQQGRRFDMALLKAMHHGWQIDLGYAFNQNNENLAKTSYVPANIPQYVKNDIGVLVPTPANFIPLINGAGNSAKVGNPTFTNPPNTNGGNQDYKNFTSLYISKKLNQTKVSFLFFHDEFGKYKLDSVAAGGGKVYGRSFDVTGTNNRNTFGTMVSPVFGNSSGFGKVAVQAAYYQQTGNDRDGKDLKAYHYTIAANYSKGKFTVGPGFDYLSGNKTTTTATESKRFDPLYGTPHKFWGSLDYFYAPTGSPAAGLKDYYFKTKFTANTFYIIADYHLFETANAIAVSNTKKLGDEVDLAINYTVNKFTTIELGYSIMKGTNTLVATKAQAGAASTYNKTGQFGYVMLNIRPDFLYTKPVAIK